MRCGSSDLTYVATWSGSVHVAFLIDAYARRIVGWRVSASLRSDLTPDALEQALYPRSPEIGPDLLHHGDRGRQYPSIPYTERLAETGIEPSVGSVGDSHDNALTETIIGLYKTELRERGPWNHLAALENATLEWVEWFIHRRRPEPIGNVPPAALEAPYHQSTGQLPMAA